MTWKMKKPRQKFYSSISGSGNSLFEKNASEFSDFHSGFVNDDEKNVELEVSVDGCPRDDELKKLKQNDQSGIDLCDPEIQKGMESTEVFDVHDPELGENSCDRTNMAAPDYEISIDYKKKGHYECRACNKVFHSYQALGGHRGSHKTINSSSVLKMERCKKSIQANLFCGIEANSKLDKHECSEDSPKEGLGGVAVTSWELEKSKEHKCPVCFKVFASGQALGGHKRAHYAGFSESGGAKESVLVEQELPVIHNTFDVNLTLPLEKEATDDVRFNLWWFGSNHEHEPLVISN
ncbi:uncharacterized protein LOC132282195 [Cornus florida]|uniref:uncharacterized protein LOC132282195 n=1 Tax=Cornus florida TaxID=4283 RepID=UPI002899DEF9|nr:uncharacterized protein LOC132282195 [Cornus florida]